MQQLTTTLVNTTINDLVSYSSGSETLLSQSPVNTRKVKALVKQLSTQPLLVMPVLANLNGKLYLVSGRHRVAALATLFDHDTMVSCVMLDVDNVNQIAELVVAYNGGRNVSVGEKLNLTTQAKGTTTVSCTGELELVSDVNYTNDKQLRETFVALFTSKCQGLVPTTAAAKAGGYLFNQLVDKSRFSTRQLTLDPTIINAVSPLVVDFLEAWDTTDIKDKARQVKVIALGLYPEPLPEPLTPQPLPEPLTPQPPQPRKPVYPELGEPVFNQDGYDQYGNDMLDMPVEPKPEPPTYDYSIFDNFEF